MTARRPVSPAGPPRRRKALVVSRFWSVLAGLATLALALGPLQRVAGELGDPDHQLVVSSSPDRADTAELHDSTLSGNRYVVLASAEEAKEVRFYLDDPDAEGPPFSSDGLRPYDLAGAGEHGASPLRTASLTNGPHSLVALATLASGETLRVEAAFSVFNDGAAVQAGVFRSTSSSAVEAFEAWLGREVPYVLDFSARQTWEEIANPSYVIDQWAASGRRPVYSVALLPENGQSSMAAGARGENRHHFRRLAEQLVAKGQADAILRLGWEFNGDWYRWSAHDGEEFKQYWRHTVEAMRSVPGQRFEFDWSVNSGPGQSGDAVTRYPGDDVVDYVGVDFYDASWAPDSYPYPTPCAADCRLTHQQNAWTARTTEARGLFFWRDFARAHGKSLTIPEWATGTRPDGHGGGDNPYYIRKMYEFLHDPDNNVAYHNYFEYDGGGVAGRLMAGQYPEAAAAYRQLFGDG